MEKYVHGYSEREKTRLEDQANALDNLLHHDTVWKAGELVLEAGCGVGAQTQIVAPKNPDCRFTSVDISADSILKARQTIGSIGIINVEFQVADIFNLPFKNELPPCFCVLCAGASGRTHSSIIGTAAGAQERRHHHRD